MGTSGETFDQRKKRARRILRGLGKLYPEADCALRHRDPLQLLIATILSAQSTDDTVNKVTPILFGRYKSAKALAEEHGCSVSTVWRLKKEAFG